MNAFSPEADQICETIYKRITDQSGNLLERYLRHCETLDIEPKELTLKKLEEFTEGGKVDMDLARVRFDHYTNRRRVKLLLLNNAIQKMEKNISKLDQSPVGGKKRIGERMDRAGIMVKESLSLNHTLT